MTIGKTSRGRMEHRSKIADAILPTHAICGRWLVESFPPATLTRCMSCLLGEQIPPRSQRAGEND